MFGYQLDWGAFANGDGGDKGGGDGLVGRNGDGGGSREEGKDTEMRKGKRDADADGSETAQGAGAGATKLSGAGAGAGYKNKVGRRADLIYVLPDVLLTTEEMKEGGRKG